MRVVPTALSGSKGTAYMCSFLGCRAPVEPIAFRERLVHCLQRLPRSLSSSVLPQKRSRTTLFDVGGALQVDANMHRRVARPEELDSRVRCPRKTRCPARAAVEGVEADARTQRALVSVKESLSITKEVTVSPPGHGDQVIASCTSHGWRRSARGPTRTCSFPMFSWGTRGWDAHRGLFRVSARTIVRGRGC